MRIRRSVIAGLSLASCSLLPSTMQADFAYQETTQITGGSIVGMMKLAGAFSHQAREASGPITSSVLVKGNRMARINPQQTEIIDLDRETITEIDHQKRQYSVITFAQMKQQIERASQEAQKKQAEAKQQGQSAAPPPSNTEISFDMHVRQTGASKQLSGLDAQEAILTMAMNGTDKTTGQTGALAITNDMWMAPEIPGYDELRDFEKRYAVKLGSMLNGAITPSMTALMHPSSQKAMKDMADEMSKIKGIPVQQIMRMGSTANGQTLPAASEAPLPQTTTPALPSAGDVAQQAAASALASKLGALGGLGGGLSGFGRKKKADPAPAPDASAAAAPAGGAAPAFSVLVESSTEMSGFSTSSIDEAKFSVPAGYKQLVPQSNDTQQ